MASNGNNRDPIIYYQSIYITTDFGPCLANLFHFVSLYKAAVEYIGNKINCGVSVRNGAEVNLEYNQLIWHRSDICLSLPLLQISCSVSR